MCPEVQPGPAWPGVLSVWPTEVGTEEQERKLYSVLKASSDFEQCSC